MDLTIHLMSGRSHSIDSKNPEGDRELLQIRDDVMVEATGWVSMTISGVSVTISRKHVVSMELV